MANCSYPTRRAQAVFTQAACAAVLLVILSSPLRIEATPQQGSRKFEVASVKRCSGGMGAQSPDRMKTPCTFLSVLITHAYVDFAEGRYNSQTFPVKIEGLPAWAD